MDYSGRGGVEEIRVVGLEGAEGEDGGLEVCEEES